MRKCDCKGLPADTGCINPSRDEVARLAQRPKKGPIETDRAVEVLGEDA